MDFVETAVVAGGEHQHHGVGAVACGREGGAFGAHVLLRLGAQRADGNLGDQRAGAGMAIEGFGAGPQLERPVAVIDLGRGGDEQLGVEADVVAAEAVGMG